MENVIVAIFCIALILFGALTISEASLNSTDEIASAWRQMEQTSGEISRTNISSISASNSGDVIDVILLNAGETRLQDFEDWDVIVQYYDDTDALLIDRLSFIEPPLIDGSWIVEGMYLDALATNAEVFDSGIFNPDEYAKIQLEVPPTIKSGGNVRVTISTPNGVSASAMFVAS